ncbi:hypothetical protein DPMN_043709 [Dreissena polymorpha]|uniref:Uncharacterized protein n=1 Tax=Dreissena polymorpha TaxID=45954 RepID=A0A9D4D0Z9_DREPO|nr:hypothetical protein DPMN_043709 [Dreissena polymorpha]
MMSYGSGEWMGCSGLELLQTGLVRLLGQLDINAGAMLKTTTTQWAIGTCCKLFYNL